MISRGDIERFANFSAKNLIEIHVGLIGEKNLRVHVRSNLHVVNDFAKILPGNCPVWLNGIFSLLIFSIWERSGSVVECLTRDRGAAGSSLTGVTALCP